MNRFFAFIFILTFFTLLNVQAALYKGQREFVKQCVSCHKEGQNFIATKRKLVWKSYTRNSGKRLQSVHLKSQKAKSSHEYFRSSDFSRKVRHLEDFLLEYAKDSGNVPACN